MKRVAGWFRARVGAIVALVVLGGVSIGYSFTIDWQQYLDSRPIQHIEVPRGEQAAYAGGTFAIDDLVVIVGDSADGQRYDVTPGTDLVVLDLAITPDPDGDPDGFVGCDIRFEAPSPDGEREWWPEVSNPSTYPDPADPAFGCDVGSGPAYEYRQYFVVPAGGATDGVVQITNWEVLPRALRLH